MPHWHQKNRLCYNSRYSEFVFGNIVTDYCRGIPASQSSKEFEEHLDVRITRQTIADYFRRLSLMLVNERQQYPWWSIAWSEMSMDQEQLVRDIVYADGFVLKDVRASLEEVGGHSGQFSSYLYVEVLRSMSKAMKGIPKKQFWIHLIRACEIALPYEIEYEETGVMPNYPIERAMTWSFDQIMYLLKDGHFLFNRKESPATRREERERKEARRSAEVAEARSRLLGTPIEPSSTIDYGFKEDHVVPPRSTRFIRDNSEIALQKRKLAAVVGDLEIDFGKWVAVE